MAESPITPHQQPAPFQDYTIFDQQPTTTSHLLNKLFMLAPIALLPTVAFGAIIPYYIFMLVLLYNFKPYFPRDELEHSQLFYETWALIFCLCTFYSLIPNLITLESPNRDLDLFAFLFFILSFPALHQTLKFWQVKNKLEREALHYHKIEEMKKEYAQVVNKVNDVWEEVRLRSGVSEEDINSLLNHLAEERYSSSRQGSNEANHLVGKPND